MPGCLQLAGQEGRMYVFQPCCSRALRCRWRASLLCYQTQVSTLLDQVWPTLSDCRPGRWLGLMPNSEVLLLQHLQAQALILGSPHLCYLSRIRVTPSWRLSLECGWTSLALIDCLRTWFSHISPWFWPQDIYQFYLGSQPSNSSWSGAYTFWLRMKWFR